MPKNIIAKNLGISDEVQDKESDLVPMVVTDGESDANKDYDRARDNTHELLNVGMDAVSDLADIAKRTQDSESFASLALLMKTCAQLNRDLANLALKKPQFHPNGENGPIKNITTNQTLILTTAQLQELIENKGED